MANDERREFRVDVARATAADIEDLIPLYCGFMVHERVEPPPAAELSRRVQRLLASETDEVLIARDGSGAAVGYLQQRYYLSVWRPDRDAYIEDVFVAEETRGRGAGRQLVEAALKRARACGAARISLDTNERNARARGLYEALGFQNADPAWDGGGQLNYSRRL